MSPNSIVERALVQARGAGPSSDRNERNRRVENDGSVESTRRTGGRPIRRRGSRASLPARDRLCQRWYD